MRRERHFCLGELASRSLPPAGPSIRPLLQGGLQAFRPSAEAKAARERLTPQDERLTPLLATIPIEVQREGLSLAALQASLRGRRRGHCHPGELGAALRRLGFVRQRDWSGADGFSAVWYPK